MHEVCKNLHGALWSQSKGRSISRSFPEVGVLFHGLSFAKRSVKNPLIVSSPEHSSSTLSGPRDAFGATNEHAQQRDEQGREVQTGEGVDAGVNYASKYKPANRSEGTSAGVLIRTVNGDGLRPIYTPDTYIPVEGHVLYKPARKVKTTSIGWLNTMLRTANCELPSNNFQA